MRPSSFSGLYSGIVAVVTRPFMYWKTRRDIGWSGRYSAAGTILMAVFVTWLVLLLLLTYVSYWLKMFPPEEGAGKMETDTASVAEMLAWRGLGLDAGGR